jgi:hypothetical protein
MLPMQGRFMSETRLYENRPYGSYEGVAFGPAFLCGIPWIAAEGGFYPPILAAPIGPSLGSTWRFFRIIFGT